MRFQREEVAAFGDADYHTLHYNEDGVAYGIYEILKI